MYKFAKAEESRLYKLEFAGNLAVISCAAIDFRAKGETNGDTAWLAGYEPALGTQLYKASVQ